VEETFRHVPGVIDTAVGFSNGRTADPTYEDVCTDTTGHAEAVQVTFDPAKVTFEELLKVFWKAHDPTGGSRQEPDSAGQYRSAIFFHSPEQEASAKKSLAAEEAGRISKRPIVTQIAAAGPFYRAAEYHQKYLQKSRMPC
jgi:peptide-methionine (S)-S-oxide reductase